MTNPVSVEAIIRLSKPYLRINLAFLWLGLCIIYIQTLHWDPLLYDDPVYLHESPLSKLSLFSGIFWHQLFTEPVANLWHPVTVLSHQVLLRLSPDSAILHRLCNLLLHGLAFSLWMILFSKYQQKARYLVLFTMLCAWHPVTVESVAWISARKDLLCHVFLAGSILSYISWHEEPRRLHLSLCIICAVLALMAKPIAVILPSLLCVMSLWPLQLSRDAWKRSLAVFLPITIISMVVILLTLHFQSSGNQAVAETMTVLEKLARASWAMQHSVSSIFYPMDLHAAYQDPLIIRLWRPIVTILSLCVVLSIGYVFWRKKRPELLAASLWFLLCLLPTVGLIRAGNDLAADRYVYLPLLALIFASAFFMKKPNKLMSVMLYGMGIILVALSFFQTRTWQDDRSFLTQVIKHQPNNAFAHSNLALLAHRENDLSTCWIHLEKALKSRPKHAHANSQAGELYFRNKNYEEAYQHLLIALPLRSSELWLYERLSACALYLNKYEEAIAHCEAGVELVSTLEQKEHFQSFLMHIKNKQNNDFPKVGR